MRPKANDKKTVRGQRKKQPEAKTNSTAKVQWHENNLRPKGKEQLGAKTQNAAKVSMTRKEAKQDEYSRNNASQQTGQQIESQKVKIWPARKTTGKPN